MGRVLCALALLWGSVAGAAVLDANIQSQGMLATAQVATGVTANSVKYGRSKVRAMVFTIWNTAGTATVQLEINCGGTPAPPWAPVRNSAINLAVEAQVLDIVYPACEYRANVTACASCNVNVAYFGTIELQ